MDLRHPKKRLIEHGICMPSCRWMRKKPQVSGRKLTSVGMRLFDECPDTADRKMLGKWEGDLIIGQDGASVCATWVERTTRYLVIVTLDLGYKADQVCDALTCRIQGPPDGAMRTLIWDHGWEMARHQRLTDDTGVDVFFVHPTAAGREKPMKTPTGSSADTYPKAPIISREPYLDANACELNNCLGATLGYRAP